MSKILLIITGSIAASRCKEIITLLNINEVKISCILTKEAKKYVKISDIKKLLKNRIFTDEDEKKNKMLHINLSRNNRKKILDASAACWILDGALKRMQINNN